MHDEMTPLAPDPSPGSSAASSTSETNAFAGDPGPGFDPATAAAPLAPAPAGDWTLGVSEEQVRDVLGMGGDAVHMAVGVGEVDWAMTKTDLDRIAPPLTRILNRYPAVAEVVQHSDELAVAGGVGLWAWRSILERRAVLDAHAGAHEREAGTPPVPAGSVPGEHHVQSVEVVPGYTTVAERLAATPAPGAGQ